MTQKQIWAPWRLDYVTGGAAQVREHLRPAAWLDGADQGCFLCQDVAEAAAAADVAARTAVDRINHVVEHAELVVAVLNRYPYNNGHLLIAPRRHAAEPGELTDAEQQALAAAINRALAVLRRILSPDGFNLGLNLGRVAGAGLPGHLHWHVVPRWNGDTNFMPALCGVRVIPQSLDALWEVLSHEFASGN